MDEELYLLGSLEDMTVSTMMIVEGTENKRPGVLCEVEGPFIVLDKNNNNDRWYTNSLIDNRILGIPYTKKMLENRTLYGEASHPSDRFDVKLPLISHNITALWYNEDKTILMGRADVLDTPSGRIIYTLIQYGSKIGISVRARGRLVNKGGKKVPDESVYQFKTFDFVPNPGFDEARMNRVDESVDDDLASSFMKYVAEASVSDLSCIQSIFESANEEIFGDVKKVIHERMNENTMTQQESDDTSVADVLYEEAVKNEEHVLELEEQIADLRGQLDESERARGELQSEVSTLKADVEQKGKDIEDITLRLMSLTESEDSLREENGRLQGRVTSLTGTLKGLRGKNAELSQRLEESEQSVQTLQSENKDVLEKLEEAQSSVVVSEIRDLSDSKSEGVKKKKVLPQGKSTMLNESVVDTPMTLTQSISSNNSRRQSFIKKCSS